jgi:hypothetical protein
MTRIPLFFFFVLLCNSIFSQEKAVFSKGALVKEIPALKDVKLLEESKLVKAFDADGKRIWPTGVVKPILPISAEAAVGDNYVDPVLQKQTNVDLSNLDANSRSGIAVGFEGQATGVRVFDPTICVGTNHVIQLTNTSGGTSMQIYNKAGVAQGVPLTLQAFTGFPGNGDPIALYDPFSDRYILTEFIIGNGTTNPSGMSILVSKTNDPTLGFFLYRWTIPEALLLDYPKWAVGPNGLFLHTNNFNLSGSSYKNSFFVAFNKNDMYSGSSTFRTLRITQSIGDAFSTCAAQAQGTTAPTNGQVFVGFSGASAAIIECTPNWTNNTFTQTRVGLVPMASYSANICGASGEICIEQPFPGIKVDALTKVIMNQPTIRVLPNGQTGVVFCFTVNAGNGKAGIRWVEARRTGTVWSTFQQGTWHPNNNHQFMGSIAYDGVGNIGLAYCTGGLSTFLGIRYTGRKTCDPLGQMTLPETLIREGNATTDNNRWGDYSHLVVDPDGQSLWITAMYGKQFAVGGRGSYIANFSVPNCGEGCLPPTFISAVGTSNTTALASWSAVGDALSYTVEYKTIAATNWITAGTTSSTLLTITGLSPLTLYDVRVKANCASGNSGFTVAQFTTSFCGSPLEIYSNNITPTTVDLSWLFAVNGANDYTVEFKPANTTTWIAATTIINNSFTLTGLTPSTLYDWRVRGNCTIYPGDFIAAQFTTTAAVCTAPTGLSSGSISSSSALVSWAAAPFALSYSVEFKPANATNWISAGAIFGNSVNLSNLVPNTIYDWRVVTNCSFGVSGFATAQFTTGIVSGVCGVPTNLSNFSECYAVPLTWSAVAGAASYRVEFQRPGTTAWLLLEAGTTALSSEISGTAGLYGWRVQANCSGTTSAFANSTARILSATICNQRAVVVVDKEEALKQFTTIKVTPQPAQDAITISYTAIQTGNVSINIVNTSGVSVQTKSCLVQKGGNRIAMEISKLLPGSYILTIRQNGKLQTCKIIVG